MTTGGEISALVRELREEVERLEHAGDTGVADLPALLRRMHALSAVTADRPAPVAPGRLAPLKRRLKRLMGRAMRWYVEPVAVDTRRFAEAASQTARALHDEAAAHAAALAVKDEQIVTLERRVAALTDRIGRLERGARPPARGPEPAEAHDADGGPAATPPPAAPPAAPLDYFAFEGLMRGSRDEILERQRQYVAEFAGVDDILDAGCGRGEFLTLLRDAGKRACGVDADADMVSQCRADGLDVRHGDVVAEIAARPPGSLGGVFSAQLVEHLPPPALTAFLTGCARALRPGGVLVLETINPVTPAALRNYFADLTHAQPLVPQTLAFLVESAGFTDVRVELKSPVPDPQRLTRVTLGQAAPPEAQAAADRNVDLVNAALFAPLDYAVVARA